MLRNVGLLAVLLASTTLATVSVAAEVLTPPAQTAQPRATLPVFDGTYTTPTASGTITYSATRLFYRVGSGGWMRVDGKRYWGVMATSRGVTGLTWYYGTDSTGPEAGRATLTYDAATLTYSGPIQFTTRAGVVTGSGSVTLKVK
jgi:hypothetical protein